MTSASARTSNVSIRFSVAEIVSAIVALVLAWGIPSLLVSPRGALAAAPSPRLYEGMAPAERRLALTRVQTTLDSLRRGGVDRIYPQFALDMGKYPREGVAHTSV